MQKASQVTRQAGRQREKKAGEREVRQCGSQGVEEQTSAATACALVRRYLEER